MKRAYLEKAFVRYHDDLPMSDSAFTVVKGLRAHGVPVESFTDFETIRDKITPETFVHGWVRDVLHALDQMGKPRPSFSTLPEGATEVLGRETTKTTLGYVRNTDSLWPVFIKPIEHKVFTGYVVRGFSDFLTTSHLPDSTPIYMQPEVTFISEYRCFVHWDRVVAIRHYHGDCEVFPDMTAVSAIQNTILRRQYMPVAYSLDIGILPDGKNVLVEMNDSFALGSYGLSWGLYLPLVHDRWTELVTDPNVWGNHMLDLYLAREITFHELQTRLLGIVYSDKFKDERIDHAYLIWCEYTSCVDCEESWFRWQLMKRLEPNPVPL